jgi:hypothetical protein
MITDNDPDLPLWFRRPEPVTDRQPCLFKQGSEDIPPRAQVSADELRRWHSNGWLSFDFSATTKFDAFGDPRIWEVLVVRDIVRSGLSDAQVEYLLQLLPKPYTFNPDRLAFSFCHGWVEAVPPEAPDIDAMIDDHLDSWLEGCDNERLSELQSKISALLTNPDQPPAKD